METCGSRHPDPKNWRVLYRTAILETNKCAIAKELSDAEHAIVGRTLQLFQESGADVDQERDALDDALYALEALRIALQQNTRAA